MLQDIDHVFPLGIRAVIVQRFLDPSVFYPLTFPIPLLVEPILKCVAVKLGCLPIHCQITLSPTEVKTCWVPFWG